MQLEIVTNVPSSNVCSLKGDPVTATSEQQLSPWAELTVEDKDAAKNSILFEAPPLHSFRC